MNNIIHISQKLFRRHVWNEAGQLSAMVDNKHCGYYGYDANGDRGYKLTGQSVQDQYNAGTKQYHVNFNDVVLYANPYFIVTPKGYTKHYYNGSQRVATRIGSLEDLPDDIIDTSAIAKERIHNARSYMDAVLGTPYVYQSDTTAVFADIDGNTFDELQWQCDETNWTLQMSVLCDSDMLYPILTKNSRNLDLRVSGVYYYHPDHLGSATWITNSEKQPVQYIHYMPFGELWYNQQASAYNERFKFTGKERDAETGYDFFGARYYSSTLLSWLSPDPLLKKYPHISSYAYCSWNPINKIDPDGRDVNVINNGDGTYTTYSGEINDDLNIYIVDNNGQRTGEVLGQTLTPYTFFGGNDQFIEGATINMHDYSGQEFLSHITIDDPNPVLYAIQALPYGDNDFKNNGYVDGMNKTQHHYRAMPINVFDGSGTKIATARDIGNYAAGFVAGSNGLSWGQTRTMFDRVQGNLISSRPEPKVSTSAQYTGYQWGYQILGQFRRYGNK